MKDLENKKKRLILKFNKESRECNKNKLFGNNRLIRVLIEIRDVESLIKSSVECNDCNGNGFIDCDCDCPRCDKEYTCDACGGDGYLEK